MQRLLITIALLFCTQLVGAQINDRPKMVVGIVVDQMRYEYLQRYWDQFEEGGFKRLVNEGYRFDQMHFNYMPTYTGPGHASLYAGNTPAVNGIVGNNWIDAETGKSWYCVEDPSVEPLGTNDPQHRMSPNNLLSSSITDQLKLSTNFQSKVISISLKDRGAILPGGHFADWAFWLNKDNGEMVSSDFYGETLPEWFREFNNKNLPEQYLSEPWETLLPMEEYTSSYKDDNAYEGLLAGEEDPTFPHDLPAIAEKEGNGLIYYTPFGNDYVWDLAKAAIPGESLGQDEITDFLALSFSTTDVIGHIYGPQSVEVEDTYLRLDRTLADMLTYLDEIVGQGEYLVFLTADHGAADVPAFVKDQQGKGGYFQGDSLFRELKHYMADHFSDTLVQKWYNQQVYFNPSQLPSDPATRKKVYAKVKAFYQQQEGVARVYSEFDLEHCKDGLPFCEEIARGYWPQRSGELVVLLKPGWMEYSQTGTTHGSPYSYDTHVPLVFYGWNMEAGRSGKHVVIESVAPTIANLLGISLPSGNTGEPLKFDE